MLIDISQHWYADKVGSWPSYPGGTGYTGDESGPLYEPDFIDQFSGETRKLTHIGREPEIIEEGELDDVCEEFTDLIGTYDGCWPLANGCSCPDFLYKVTRLPIKAVDDIGDVELPVPVFMLYSRKRTTRTAGQYASNWKADFWGDYAGWGSPYDPIQRRTY